MHEHITINTTYTNAYKYIYIYIYLNIYIKHIYRDTHRYGLILQLNLQQFKYPNGIYNFFLHIYTDI